MAKRFIRMVGLVVAMSMIAAVPSFAEGEGAAQASTVVQSTNEITSHTMKTSQLESFGYYLFTPVNATEDMPLIVLLHSAGMIKNRTSPLGEGMAIYLQNGGKRKVPAYVVIPCAPFDYPENKDWLTFDASLMELIDSVSEEYKIDRNRISITGLSMGGDGAIALAAAHPDVFSCAVPVAPFYYKNPYARFEESWPEALKNLPIWFISEGKEEGAIKSRNAAQAINDAGGNASVTVIEEARHDSIVRMIFPGGNSDAYGIVDWMISNRKE